MKHPRAAKHPLTLLAIITLSSALLGCDVITDLNKEFNVTTPGNTLEIKYTPVALAFFNTSQNKYQVLPRNLNPITINAVPIGTGGKAASLNINSEGTQASLNLQTGTYKVTVTSSDQAVNAGADKQLTIVQNTKIELILKPVAANLNINLAATNITPGASIQATVSASTGIYEIEPSSLADLEIGLEGPATLGERTQNLQTININPNATTGAVVTIKAKLLNYGGQFVEVSKTLSVL